MARKYTRTSSRTTTSASSAKLNSSQVDTTRVTNLLNNAIDKLNLMIGEQKNFSNDIVNITRCWKGGGRSRNSSLVRTVNTSEDMSNYMGLGINTCIDMINSVKSACELLARSYSGDDSFRINLHSVSDRLKEFSARYTMNTSVDDMAFDGNKVYGNYTNSKKRITNYLDYYEEVDKKINDAINEGVNGTNLSSAFSSYTRLSRRVKNEVYLLSSTYKRTVLEKIQQVSKGESDAGNIASQGNSGAGKKNTLTDSISALANSLIGAVTGELDSLSGRTSKKRKNTTTTTSTSTANIDSWIKKI